MPIYEYVCDECGHEFELLLRGDAEPACPECRAHQLTRRVSLPRIRSEVTREKSMRAARKRDAEGAERRMRTRMEYEESHDH